MQDSPFQSSIRDNHDRGKAGEFLKSNLEPNSALSVVSAYFTIHAYHALKHDLDNIDNLRFLFGDPQFVNRLDKDHKESREYALSEGSLSLGNQLQQSRIARECAEWIESKAAIRSVTQTGLLHGKLYHIRNGASDQALLDLSATQEDNLLENEQVDDLITKDLLFRNKQLKRMQSEILDLEDFEETISLADFSLDEFRIDLLQFLEAKREELEAAKPGLYAVVPPKADIPASQPGVIFCLRHRGEDPDPAAGNTKDAETARRINPLGRFYLVYVLDDGTVRITFTQPKQALNLFRDLAAGHPEAQQQLCDLFDQRTHDGADMGHYDGLVKKALESIAHTFSQRATASLFSGRDGKLPGAAETPRELETEYELLTWLVILGNES